MAGNGMVVVTSKIAYKRLCRGNYASSGTGPYRFSPGKKADLRSSSKNPDWPAEYKSSFLIGSESDAGQVKKSQ